MPDKEKPVGIISIRYPATETIVRFHRDDNNVLWVVGADICEMIGLTNISYVGKKLGETKKEYIKTKGGKQAVLWFSMDSVEKLCREYTAVSVLNWIRFSALMIPMKFKGNEYVFKDPIIIERSTLSKMLDVMEELHIQNVI